MRAPSHERVCALDVLAWEAALASAAASRNGHALPADVQWLVSHRALAAPVTAAACPHVRAALPPDVRAAVLALAAAPVTVVAATPSQRAGSQLPDGVAASGHLGSREAAQALRMSDHGARAACRRGTLCATKDDGGRWLIAAADVDEYRRTHGENG